MTEIRQKRDINMIEYIDLDHAQELDAFVCSHKNHHFMQTSAWGRVKTDWGWYGMLCRDEGGAIVGSMALLRHNIHFFKTCMLYAPRGPICDYEDRAVLRELRDGAVALAKKCGAYLLRMDPRLEETETDFVQTMTALGFTVDNASDFSLFQPRMCYVTDLAGLTPDTLETIYHKTARTHLHRAWKNQVTVRMGTVEDLPRFCEMMEQTAQKNDFEARSEWYFRSFLNGLGSSAGLYLAEHEGKVISGSISVLDGDRGFFMYGCSDRDYLKLCPNELLQWQMQVDALKAGCRWFDFRGVEGHPTPDNPHYGLHRYKQGFGAAFHAYAGQFDFLTRPLMKRLVDASFKLKERLG